MKPFLLICAVVALMGGGQPAVTREEVEKREAEAAAETKTGAWVSDPNDSNNVKIEKVIRKSLKRIWRRLRSWNSMANN